MPKKGYKQTEEHRRNNGESRKGKPSNRKGAVLSEETKGLLSQRAKEQHQDPEFRKKYEEGLKHRELGNTARKYTDEQRQECRERMQRKWQEPEYRKNQTNSIKQGWAESPVRGEMHNQEPHPKSGSGKSGYREDIGMFVRSTWEANVVRVFQLCEISFEYESKYDIGNGECYRPDFKLDTMCIEVKGYWTDRARYKFDKFKEVYSEIEIKVIEWEDYKVIREYYKPLLENWED